MTPHPSRSPRGGVPYPIDDASKQAVRDLIEMSWPAGLKAARAMSRLWARQRERPACGRSEVLGRVMGWTPPDGI
jgi:hypothetical protein